MTAQFLPASVIAAPGSGATSVTFSAGSNLVPKTYLVVLTATGGGVTQTQTVTVNVPGFSLTPSALNVTVTATMRGKLKVTSVVIGGFDSSLALSVSGLPAGVTASFSPQIVARPGNGSSVITLTKVSGTANGSSHFTVSAAGASLSQSKSVGLTVK
jgi:hypothetical protein